MAVLFAVLAMMVRNVVVNLAAIGKEFSFGFLFTPAGYDITFSPFIEYTSRSTHLRAATVGVFNTLLVAAFGIVLGTIMGFILGNVRLSSNWSAIGIAYVFIVDRKSVAEGRRGASGGRRMNITKVTVSLEKKEQLHRTEAI